MADYLADLRKSLRGVEDGAQGDMVGALERAALPKQRAALGKALEAISTRIMVLPMKGSKLEAVQRAVILHAFVSCNGNISATARMLGVERKVVERKLARYARSASSKRRSAA